LNRIKKIDGLRGIAALSVVLFHYTSNYRDDYSLPFNEKFDFKYGFLGVELFFIISGFVIFNSIKNVENYKEFLVKRFSRLFPIFWICMMISFFVTKLGHLSNRVVPTIDFLYNFTMIPIVFGKKNVDGVYWSLYFELIFYSMIALVLIFKLKNNWRLLCGVWMLFSLIVNLFFSDINIIKSVLLLNNFNYLFIIGICFYQLSLKSTKPFIELLMIIFATISYLYFKKNNLDQNIEAMILIVIIGVFYFLESGIFNFLESNFFQFLGYISYVLYLTHMNIGYVIMKSLVPFYDSISVLIILIPLIFILGLSYFLSKFIEKPLVKYANTSLFSILKMK
jgi:peptidoglycan/LPS O-acetylase OafA/YrhL